MVGAHLVKSTLILGTISNPSPKLRPCLKSVKPENFHMWAHAIWAVWLVWVGFHYLEKQPSPWVTFHSRTWCSIQPRIQKQKSQGPHNHKAFMAIQESKNSDVAM